MSFEIVNIDKHVKLVQLQPDQADRLFELTNKNRGYLSEFLPWPSHVKAVDDSRRHIEETLENRSKGEAYTYGMEYDGQIVGDITLRNIKDTEKPPEIGYWIARDYSGKGLTTKSVQALTDLGLSALGLDEIIIKADPQNIASNKVAEKAGYVLAGHETNDGKLLNIWQATRK